MAVNVNKIEETFNACKLINKERSAHPYQIRTLKEKYPKIVTELKTILLPILEAIDNLMQHKNEYLAEIAKEPNRTKRKKLIEYLDILTDPKNADMYINLHNELI